MITPITLTFKGYVNKDKSFSKKKDQSPMEGNVKIARPIAKPLVNPLKSSLSTTASWFGFGIVLDRITGFASKYIKTSPLKTSIITNGVIAIGAGAYQYFKDSKINNKKASE